MRQEPRSGVPRRFRVLTKSAGCASLLLRGLIGPRKDAYLVSVSGNWRLTFRIHGEDAMDVQIEDYH